MVKTRKDFSSDEGYQCYLEIRKEYKKNKGKYYMWEIDVETHKNNLISLIEAENYKNDHCLKETLKYYIESLKTRDKYRKLCDVEEYFNETTS